MYFEPKNDISIDDAITRYFDQKQATNTLSDKSIHNRLYELKRFSKFCHDHHITKPHEIHKNLLVMYLKQLKISSSSKLSVIYILKGFMDYLVDEELILDNILETLDKPKIYPPKNDYLSFSELEKLFQSEAENAPEKVVDRNLLLFSLFVDLCLRVSEVVNLKHPDVRLDSKEVWIVRKRNKVEKIPINDEIIKKFHDWYEVRKTYKGNDQEWVFLSTHGKQLTPRQVHYIISQALERANIIKRSRGPHLLRHSGASLKAQAGENPIMIQYLLGHENLNTTKRYLHFDWEDLKKMVNRSPRLHTPSDELKVP